MADTTAGVEARDDPLSVPGGKWRWLAWLPGALLFAGLVAWVFLHRAEERRLGQLLHDVRPSLILAAAALQVGTYFCAGGVWRAVLARAGSRPRLRILARLAVVKLAIDSLIPTVGVSGTLVVAQRLRRHGVPGAHVASAMLIALVSYYLAYGAAVIAAVAILWSRQELNAIVIALAVSFAILVLVVPGAILWALRHPARTLPAWLARRRYVQDVLRQAAAVSPELSRDRALLLGCTLLQLGVLLLDSATLAVALVAVGEPLAPTSAFVGALMGGVAATVGLLPAGVGTFEATCVAVLSWTGTPMESALAATLLLRGFTLWLPLLAGTLLSERRIHGPPRRR